MDTLYLMTLLFFFAENIQDIIVMKRILGLDLETNSIAWAVVNEAENTDEQSSIYQESAIQCQRLTDTEGNIHSVKILKN